CQSGLCQGPGCNDDKGVCVAKGRPCTLDYQAYCGCDGRTFHGSGSCPNQRYASRGECKPAARAPSHPSHVVVKGVVGSHAEVNAQVGTLVAGPGMRRCLRVPLSLPAVVRVDFTVEADGRTVSVNAMGSKGADDLTDCVRDWLHDQHFRPVKTSRATVQATLRFDPA
ncbi:MAG TPA: hypothetical protein VL172_02590, partial [Kofleriaceae bacterium]|nr:hypothetical protein [Kofleriaceae bacterium]